MTSTLQGIVVALLIAFLVGVLAGYSFLQNRLRQQSEALRESQRRLAELEQSHELRLRETTERLRTDYEAELAATIEHYQDQLSQKTLELEQTYETRFRVLQQGMPSPTMQPVGVGGSVEPTSEAPARPYNPPRGTVEPLPDPAEQPLSQPEILHLKRQYEMRLKEAAQKLQKAYENQLSQHAKTVRSDLQAEYEKRLAEKLQEQEQQLEELKAQLEAEYTARQASFDPVDSMEADFAGPTPSQIMGTGDDTTVTLSPASYGAMSPQRSPLLPDEAVPQRPPATQYTQDDIDARIREVAEQMRQNYEQQLSAKLEDYQLQVTTRLQELETDYERRLADLAARKSQTQPQADDDDDLGPLDLSDISQLT